MDPITPKMLGVSLYLSMLTRYPMKTVENPTIVTLPDFSVTNRLAIYSPDENASNKPTFKNM
jgi:hypothetical protein